MAGRGSKPGEHRGGRKAGTPNRATTEAVLAAERHVVEAKASGRKLAKEVLDEFMGLFAGYAAYYQPDPRQPIERQVGKNEDKFLRYAELAVKCAKELAPFQSPTFRAIAVVPPPPDDPTRGRPKRFTLTVFDTGGKRVELMTPTRGRAPAAESEDA